MSLGIQIPAQPGSLRQDTEGAHMPAVLDGLGSIRTRYKQGV